MAEHNRRRIAVLIYSMVNAVIFGAGLITVLLVPALKAHLGFWIVVVVITSFVLAVPIAWLLAPRLQARYDQKLMRSGRRTELRPIRDVRVG